VLHLSREKSIINKFQRFLGIISAETRLKMDYFDSRSKKIAKRWGLRFKTLLPPADGGFALRSLLRLND